MLGLKGKVASRNSSDLSLLYPFLHILKRLIQQLQVLHWECLIDRQELGLSEVLAPMLWVVEDAAVCFISSLLGKIVREAF